MANQRQSHELWAIAAYFNPAGWRRRRENYRIFRERLGVPLATVELAFDADFELADGDADILVQMRGGDVMWQKERLLNVALASLPPACRYVAWIDCDVVFAREGWAEAAARTLERRPMLQPFANVHYLPPDQPEGRFRAEDACLTRPSTASIGSSERFVDFEGRGPAVLSPGATGMVWAARRDVLDRHGLYDACIVGGGCNAIYAAAHGAPEHAIRRQSMNGRHIDHYRAWAEGFAKSVAGDVATLDGDIFHLWHGDLANRGRPVRHQTLAASGFDPAADIAEGGDGAWRWASDKPDLHNYLRHYFRARREDG